MAHISRIVQHAEEQQQIHGHFRSSASVRESNKTIILFKVENYLQLVSEEEDGEASGCATTRRSNINISLDTSPCHVSMTLIVHIIIVEKKKTCYLITTRSVVT